MLASMVSKFTNQTRRSALKFNPAQLFRKEHFFRGSDNDDQLLRIMKALGTVRFDEYLRTYAIHFETDHAGLLEKCAV
jgi:hypothetical protein